ncbi:hypothetical protein PISMIDRAFT_690478 [Pisolithus microcarpus 441]|uniref:peptidylprolyl isomerase n=1 Tax=Pisolithus microcarpus 441 TaxID=765257 RepID=A0A0C9XG26_9AGAM|nr:hypothetical protein PISMIDRAFT_690478 [Pisolithus microcarpus 441]
MDNKASRFGNPAFRMFYDKVDDVGPLPSWIVNVDDPPVRWNWLAPSLHVTLPHFPEDATAEASHILYVHRAIANASIMEGGWSQTFNAGCEYDDTLLRLILCISFFRDLFGGVGVLSESDHVALVIRAFWRYIQVMRTGSSLPAPMVYGASMTTTSCPSCSDLLNYEGSSISVQKRSMIMRSSTNWRTTICALLVSDKNRLSPVALAYARRHFSCENMGKGQPGMIKMYKAVVPGKPPVTQHPLFGTILPCEGPPPPFQIGNERTRGGHVHEG